ncbi:hypothetical protein PAPHI01_2797, partial [Pancytospora philotis]
MRLLHKNGFGNYVRPKKPHLTPVHVKNRLKFAKEMKRMPEGYWDSVIFTDECKFNLFGSDGPRTTYRLPGPPSLPCHFTPTVKFGGGSVMVWGAITSQGVGNLVFIDSKMDAKLFVETLATGLEGTIEMRNANLKDIILQQDNDPKHTSRLAKKFISEFNMNVMPWPSYSLDLNPIENVWQ